MANKQMKRCSASLVIKKMQVKIIIIYHFTSSKMAIIKNKNLENSKCYQWYGDFCWWEFKMIQLLWETVWWFLKKLNIELRHDLATSYFWDSLIIYEHVILEITGCHLVCLAQLILGGTVSHLYLGISRCHMYIHLFVELVSLLTS